MWFMNLFKNNIHKNTHNIAQGTILFSGRRMPPLAPPKCNPGVHKGQICQHKVFVVKDLKTNLLGLPTIKPQAMFAPRNVPLPL